MHRKEAQVGEVSHNLSALLNGCIQLFLDAAQLAGFVYLEEGAAADLVDGAPARHDLHQQVQMAIHLTCYDKTVG